MSSTVTDTTNAAANTAAATSPSGSVNKNDFLKLLIAQMKNQDPMNPMDPSQMVDQLTQINSLQQLIQIQSDLQQVLNQTPSATQTNSVQAIK